MNQRATVIIPTFNRRAKVLRCLRALPDTIDIIVVDDGSTDGTSVAIQSLARGNVHVIRQSNRGPAAARNRGVRYATGNILLFTDDDCVPGPGWASALMEQLVQSPKDIGAVGGRVLGLGSDIYSRYYVMNRILEPPPTLSYVVTANCAIRREAFHAAGGFPEGIRRAGGEDPFLSHRMRAEGYRLGYAPDAIVYHEFRQGFIDFVGTFFRYGRGCAHVVDV